MLLLSLWRVSESIYSQTKQLGPGIWMWALGDLPSDPALWPTICAIWRPRHAPQYGTYWWKTASKITPIPGTKARCINC